MVWQGQARRDQAAHRAGARRRRAGPHRAPARARPAHDPRTPRHPARRRLLPRGRRARRRGGSTRTASSRSSRPRPTSWASARSTGGTSPSAAKTSRSAAAPPSTSPSAFKGGDVGGFPEELAREYLVPLVLLIEGGGGNVQRIASEGAPPLFAGNHQFMPAVEAMMYVPVVGAVLGFAAGGPGRPLAARALERDDEGDVRRLRRRAARRATGDGPGAHPSRARRPADPRPPVRHHRQRGGRRGGRLPPDQGVPLLHALQRLRAPPGRRVQRRPARPQRPRRHHPARPPPPLLDAQDPAIDARRGLDLRDQAALRAQPDHRPSPASTGIRWA